MATFTVTNLFNAGAGSLRNAIFQANTASTTDIIDFNPSLSGGTIGLTSGELGISDNLTINGLGADFLSVDAGGNPFRVFNVDDGNSSTFLEVAIKGLTITGGNTTERGGGISNQENLTVTNSTISGNTAASGGGIYNSDYSDLTVTNSTISGNIATRYGGGINTGFYSDVTVTNSTISGNTAAGDGGGIGAARSSLTVSNSTISDNTTATGYGGGIVIVQGSARVTDTTISGNTANTGGGIVNIALTFREPSDLTVSNSTISGNTAANTGGGIHNSGYAYLTLSNSTISGNTAEDEGGGIFNQIFGSDLIVGNSTISGNTANFGGGIYSSYYSSVVVTSSIIATNTDNKDINRTFLTSRGNNLIGNGDGATGFTNGVNGDQVGTTANPIDPLLGELQDNGGPTQTQALLSGSPAINAGSNPLGLEFDQRGPGFNRVVGAETDIGAYEVVPEPDSTLGVLGVAILGVVLLRKRQRQQKTKA